MHNDNGCSSSVWMETPLSTADERLKSDARADVCIVGAGIAGLSAAYLLTRAGQKVIVVDDGPIGAGQTCRSTGHLSFALDDRYQLLERLYGASGARLAAESHRAAVDKIEAIVHAEGCECEFERVDGYLVVPPGVAPDLLHAELQAAHRAGLDEVSVVEHLPYAHYDFGPALRFPDQAQFNVVKYINCMAGAVNQAGGRIFSHAHVTEVRASDAQTVQVKTAAGPTVTAGAAIVATHTPINDWVTMHTKQAAYRTYVIAAPIPRDSVPALLLWDTPDPYHYVRIRRAPGGNDSGAHDLLIVGGEDHKTGQADDAPRRYERLEAWLRMRFPMAGGVSHRWSGQIIEPVDALAFIGRNPLDRPNVYIVTGDSGNGLTHGTIAGMLLSDLILGHANPWAELYDPNRISLAASKNFAQENLNVAAQFADLVTPGDVKSAEAIQPGSGAVLRRGLHKIACYRDNDGALHECSALCPHLNCVVRWNSDERTWDCPCHGSRFTPYGKVVNGPANRGLTVLTGRPAAALRRFG